MCGYSGAVNNFGEVSLRLCRRMQKGLTYVTVVWGKLSCAEKVDANDTLPFKGVRRAEKKVLWTLFWAERVHCFYCTTAGIPGGDGFLEARVYTARQAPHPPPGLPLYALGYLCPWVLKGEEVIFPAHRGLLYEREGTTD
jgi:hypothetical protein